MRASKRSHHIHACQSLDNGDHSQAVSSTSGTAWQGRAEALAILISLSPDINDPPSRCEEGHQLRLCGFPWQVASIDAACLVLHHVWPSQALSLALLPPPALHGTVSDGSHSDRVGSANSMLWRLRCKHVHSLQARCCTVACTRRYECNAK